MKLILLACVVAVALARPAKLTGRSFGRARQFQPQGFAQPQQFQPPSFSQLEQFQLPSFDKPRESQQPTFAQPQPPQQPSFFRREPLQQQPLSTPPNQTPRQELSPSRKRDRDAVITSFTNELTDAGAQHSFTTDNGMERQETIQLREVTTLDERGQQVVTRVPVFSGSFQFKLDDGSVVTRSYTTDETGRLAWEGNDLPQVPQV